MTKAQLLQLVAHFLLSVLCAVHSQRGRVRSVSFESQRPTGAFLTRLPLSPRYIHLPRRPNMPTPVVPLDRVETKMLGQPPVAVAESIFHQPMGKKPYANRCWLQLFPNCSFPERELPPIPPWRIELRNRGSKAPRGTFHRHSPIPFASDEGEAERSGAKRAKTVRTATPARRNGEQVG